MTMTSQIIQAIRKFAEEPGKPVDFKGCLPECRMFDHAPECEAPAYWKRVGELGSRVVPDNLPVIVTVGESGYEPEGSEHVAFYEADSGRWYYQDTAEHFKAPVVSWRELTEEEVWNV